MPTNPEFAVLQPGQEPRPGRRRRPADPGGGAGAAESSRSTERRRADRESRGPAPGSPPAGSWASRRWRGRMSGRGRAAPGAGRAAPVGCVVESARAMPLSCAVREEASASAGRCARRCGWRGAPVRLWGAGEELSGRPGTLDRITAGAREADSAARDRGRTGCGRHAEGHAVRMVSADGVRRAGRGGGTRDPAGGEERARRLRADVTGTPTEPPGRAGVHALPACRSGRDLSRGRPRRPAGCGVGGGLGARLRGARPLSSTAARWRAFGGGFPHVVQNTAPRQPVLENAHMPATTPPPARPCSDTPARPCSGPTRAQCVLFGSTARLLWLTSRSAWPVSARSEPLMLDLRLESVVEGVLVSGIVTAPTTARVRPSHPART